MSLFGAEQHTDSSSTILKSPFTSIPNNHSIATINKQLNNLGTINQQLSTLSQQLNGLNQQSQQLQQIQNFENNLNVPSQLSVNTVRTNETTTTPTPINMNTTTMLNNNNNNTKAFTNSETAKQTHNDSNINNYFIQTDLFRSNQELLNRLQVLSLDFNNTTNCSNSIHQRNFMNTCNMQPSCYSSNQMMNGTSLMNLNENNSNNNNSKGCTNQNMNFLGSPPNLGNLTPSPVLNRNFNSSSPILNSNTNTNSPLNRITKLFISPPDNGNDVSKKLLKQSSVTALNDRISIVSDGDTKMGSPTSISILAPTDKSARSSTSIASSIGSGTIRKNDKRVTLPDFSLHITDENGKIMNSKRMSSAMPSTITRTTSEKVSNRSLLMSEVQRTAWARHTTK